MKFCRCKRAKLLALMALVLLVIMPSPNGKATANINLPMNILWEDGLPSCSKVHARLNQSGLASWYGPRFHGRKTSSGEKYDMYKLTAAHKTLPLNTRIRVINTDNGESVVLRINDRGPYVHGRMLDLSLGAANALGMRNAGVTNVKMEILCRPDPEVSIFVSPKRKPVTTSL